MAAIIQEDERAANEIIYKNCGKETVSFHPTQLLLLFEYIIGNGQWRQYCIATYGNSN